MSRSARSVPLTIASPHASTGVKDVSDPTFGPAGYTAWVRLGRVGSHLQGLQRETINTPEAGLLARMSDALTGPPRIRIREYDQQDFDEVVRIWNESGILPSPSDSCPELERARHRDPDLFLVAVQGRKVVGVVLGRFDGRRGWIQHLAVAPSARHLGLGRRLVTEVERRLFERGCPKVNLHVEPSNEAVCSFYERLGYDRRNLIFMQKWLRTDNAAARDSDRERPGSSRARRQVAGTR